jgi:hypothetical protein
MTAVLPSQRAAFDAALAHPLDAVPDGDAATRGVALRRVT